MVIGNLKLYIVGALDCIHAFGVWLKDLLQDAHPESLTFLVDGSQIRVMQQFFWEKCLELTTGQLTILINVSPGIVKREPRGALNKFDMSGCVGTGIKNLGGACHLPFIRWVRLTEVLLVGIDGRSDIRMMDDLVCVGIKDLERHNVANTFAESNKVAWSFIRS